MNMNNIEATVDAADAIITAAVSGGVITHAGVNWVMGYDWARIQGPRGAAVIESNMDDATVTAVADATGVSLELALTVRHYRGPALLPVIERMEAKSQRQWLRYRRSVAKKPLLVLAAMAAEGGLFRRRAAQIALRERFANPNERRKYRPLVGVLVNSGVLE